MSRLLWLTAIVVLVSGTGVRGQAAPGSTGYTETEANRFIIGGPQIHIPTGVFLLVRKGSRVGAIRFIAVQPDREAGTGKASYESYFQADSTGSFRSSAVRKQTGENHLKPLKGIGRLAFQTGNDRIRVGDWSFRSSSPGTIAMWTYRGSMKDYGFEFAPTSARSVDEIDASDKHLQWFRFDFNANAILQTVDLPK